MTSRNGAFRIFAFRGIDVYLHWSWFVAAIFLIQSPVGIYRGTTAIWSMLEYVSLFGLVVLHEFGHALACRQVGGQAHEIILWPLGGIAFVSPPQRPGATLWSIAAGPLVNLVLWPVFWGVLLAMEQSGMARAMPNFFVLVSAIAWINRCILIFNLFPIGLFGSSLFFLAWLPIYPLDGGQILRSLLWFLFGRARSLLIATALGLLGVAALIILAAIRTDLWLGAMAVFILLNCWQGLQQALAMVRVDRAPLRFGVACPACHAAPRVGKFWSCGHCHTTFDTFETRARCPACGASFDSTRCLNCGVSHPIDYWSLIRLPPPPPAP